MRGEDLPSGTLFSYVHLEDRVPSNHPLRRMKRLVDGILRSMSAAFDTRHAHTGRPSVPPERLLRALLRQVLYTIRSERQLMEQLDYNLLYRWFVALGSTIRCGTAPCSVPTATGGCRQARPATASTGYWPSPSGNSLSRRNIAASTAA